MRNISCIFLIFLSISVCSQQDPFLSGDVYTPVWHNPASYGTWNKFSANIIGQLVWADIQDAPRSIFINSEFKFGYSKQHAKKSKVQPAVMSGVGINLLYDEIGFQKKYNSSVNYNVQFRLANGGQLSFGISPGIQNINMDTTDWIPPSNILDPNIPVGSQTKFTMGAGIMYYHEKYFFGISATHLTATTFEKVNYTIARHYYFNGGYKFPITRNLTFFPVASFGMTSSTFEYSAMLLFQIKPGILAGFGYGRSGKLKAALGYEFKNLSLQYFISYQPTSPLPGNNLVHEMRFSYRVFYTVKHGISMPNF